MTIPTPQLSEFRLERKDNGLVHVVFDAPGRTMNVFSEAAIVEIGLIARCLEEADVPATPVNTVDQVMNDPQTPQQIKSVAQAVRAGSVVAKNGGKSPAQPAPPPQVEIKKQ